jgi:DNA-binding MarR family transcriptional regulator
MDRQELSRQVAEYCSFRGEISTLYADFAKEAGLSYASMYVLYFIYREGETCTQKIISEKTFLPKQTVNAIITAFLKQKLVELSEMQDDRRTKFVKLTKSGKKYADKIIPKIINAEIDAMGKLDDGQRVAFLDSTKQYTEYFRECLQKDKDTL